MTVPPRSPNGRKLRLRAAGVPHREASGRGDLYVKLVLELPQLDDPKLAEIAAEMDALYGDTDVRRRLKEP
jgi:DnaJ-class molecular chaperone